MSDIDTKLNNTEEISATKNVGFVSADYVFSQSAMLNNKIPEKSYYKIHGILLDIRSLMIHHAKSNQKIAKLEKAIMG